MSTLRSNGQRRGNPNRRLAQKNVRQQQRVQSVPAAFGRSMMNKAPSIRSNAGGFVISHREYVSDITASATAGNFSVGSYAVNPGVAISYPWLSSLARNFESYSFRQLSYEFESSVATSATGLVMLAADYDASDLAPGSKQQLMSYHNAVRSNIWSSCRFQSSQNDEKALGARRFVRPGSVPSGSDPKTYDVCNIFVATQGCTASQVVGELYVSYVIELFTPQSDSSVYSDQMSSAIAVGAGIAAAKPLGTSQTVTGFDNFLVDSTGLILTFKNAGQYLVSLSAVGTVLTVTPPTLTCTSRGVTSTAVSVEAPCPNAAATSARWQFIAKINSPNDTVAFNSFATAFCTTLTALTLRVAPYTYTLA